MSDAPLLTLDTWARDYLRPSMLRMLDLPDSPAGNAVMDEMVKFAFECDGNPFDVFTPAVRNELLRRAEAASIDPVAKTTP